MVSDDLNRLRRGIADADSVEDVTALLAEAVLQQDDSDKERDIVELRAFAFRRLVSLTVDDFELGLMALSGRTDNRDFETRLLERGCFLPYAPVEGRRQIFYDKQNTALPNLNGAAADIRFGVIQPRTITSIFHRSLPARRHPTQFGRNR